MAKTLFLLFEHASGYAIFERLENEEIALEAETVEKSIIKFNTFSKTVSMRAFSPFPSSQTASENVSSVSEGNSTDFLNEFLLTNLPSFKKLKKAKFQLGVDDHKLASSLQDKAKIPCVSSDVIRELLRGIRLHFHRFIKGLQEGELDRAQLGLSHHFSQNKVKYSEKREDNMVIQSICILDTVDKDLNSFYMRIREWYSWHFPELQSLSKDAFQFVKSAEILQNREKALKDRKKVVKKLKKLYGEKKKAKSVLSLAEQSIGFEINPIDMTHLLLLIKRYLSLYAYRDSLFQYLQTKMSHCAPNLTQVIGETVGARLISHAGGLLNLSKCPASTIQVLGAEKALFRALKTRSKTPKYGLIFHSKFISRAKRKDKGKVSRFLANKCAIASRIDSFSESPVVNSVYGKKLCEQIEERLEFFGGGKRPKRNVEVMHAAEAEIKKIEKQQKKIKKSKI